VAVVGLEIRSRTSFAEGLDFGDIGPYERLDGTISFAVDPGHPANRAIVDLDKAERDRDGRVRFSADFCMLQPVDAERGRRRLLFEVVNRGRKNIPKHFNRAPAPVVPVEQIEPGDGFLLRRGWTMAWCGWQWDVTRDPALMALEAPMALEEGRPIVGQTIVEFQPNEWQADKLLANRTHRPYPAADVDAPDAVMLVRDWMGGERTTIPRERWRFAHDEGGRPTPSDTHVWLEGGFEPGKLYEVVYRTRISPVVGTGLLAVRDTPAFLRHADAAAGNPAAGRIDHTFGFGVSQSGRFLRHYLYLGLNVDEQGRRVFDGMIPHVAGGRRGQFNNRYAQPSDQSTPSFGHLPPFADLLTDPATGKTDGLLRRQREVGGLPKLFMTNTSAEYWRGDGSLAHTDSAGERDVEPPPEVRHYHFSGTQHGPGSLPLGYVSVAEGARGANGFNAVDYSPLLRAALINLDRWVTAGEEPPPSAIPRLADGMAARPEDVLGAYRAIPGAAVPDPDRIFRIWRVDLGPEADRGVGRYPARAGEVYRHHVSAVDADGNELAGVRLPDLTVPVATYVGWNARAPETGGAGQTIPMQGSTFPFAATAAERQASGDPRPSIEERYRDRDDYLTRVRAAAEQLAARCHVVPDDVDLLVRLAAERYDAFARQAATTSPGSTRA
jgi:hypothetical protein